MHDAPRPANLLILSLFLFSLSLSLSLILSLSPFFSLSLPYYFVALPLFLSLLVPVFCCSIVTMLFLSFFLSVFLSVISVILSPISQDDFLYSVSIVSGITCLILCVFKFMLGRVLTSRALITDGM